MVVVFSASLLLLTLLGVRLGKLMLADSGYYAKLAEDLHERERPIKAARGRILDRNGEVLADNHRSVQSLLSTARSRIRNGSRGTDKGTGAG